MILAHILVILMISATVRTKKVAVVGAEPGAIATQVLRDQGLCVTCLEKSTAIGVFGTMMRDSKVRCIQH